MNWTRPADLKAQLLRYWERGHLLREWVLDETSFPLRLKLQCPTSAELTSQFEAVRTWIADLQTIPHLRIEWRQVRHPVMGAQRLPQSVWIDTPDAAITWLNKKAEAARFQNIASQTWERRPELISWLVRRPLFAIELADQWPRLLDLVDWLLRHPRPGIYLRQVDVPGVHSKFIEQYKIVLTELFNLVLPANVIADKYTGANQFALRYGFSDKPVRIRFRILDASIPLLSGVSHPDVMLDSGSFAALNLPVKRVFITENEINFLAFPPVSDAIVIFGAGYGWDALAKAAWLNSCAIYYWGDIDTHGFAILNQLRNKFAHVESFLMDMTTLMVHRDLWGEEEKPIHQDLPRLTVQEKIVFDQLRDNRLGKNLRLEQERIGFGWLQKVLQQKS